MYVCVCVCLITKFLNSADDACVSITVPKNQIVFSKHSVSKSNVPILFLFQRRILVGSTHGPSCWSWETLSSGQ